MSRKRRSEQNPPGAPRLYLGDRPRPLRAPERHLAEIDAWAASFDGFFPPVEPSHPRACLTYELPADMRLVDRPTTTPALQARCARALLVAAARIVAARPRGRSHQRVAVMIHQPDMFMSEVQVFLDPAYYRAFEVRTGPTQVWTRLPPERTLARDLGLALPDDFTERGWHNRNVSQDPNEPSGLHASEVWMIGEPVPV
jgi:hypothetical protein